MATAFASLFKNDYADLKCFFSHVSLGSYIDREQLPEQRKPFSSLNRIQWAKKVSIISPVNCAGDLLAALTTKSPFQYGRVRLRLLDLLDVDFLGYVKTNEVNLVSRGRPNIDNRYEVTNGTLTIDVDKSTYQRLGLVGQPTSGGGRKHKDARYVVKVDLREPSLRPGKKGYERHVYAFTNALKVPVNWLFVEPVISEEADRPSNPHPLEKHNPEIIKSTFHDSRRHYTVLPTSLSNFLAAEARAEAYKDEEYLEDLFEWIALVALDSPRVRQGNAPDPFICRYSAPMFFSTQSSDDVTAAQQESLHGGTETADELRVLEASGLFVPASVTTMFLEIVEVVSKTVGHWAAMQVQGLHGDACTVLVLPDVAQEREGEEKLGRECCVWECRAAPT